MKIKEEQAFWDLRERVTKERMIRFRTWQSRQRVTDKQGLVVVVLGRIAAKFVRTLLSLCTCLAQSRAAMACGALPPWPVASLTRRTPTQSLHSPGSQTLRPPFFYFLNLIWQPRKQIGVGSNLTWLCMSERRGRYQTMVRHVGTWGLKFGM